MNTLLKRWAEKLGFEKKTNQPFKSGFMIIDKHGVAKVDYSDPKARESLRRQIDEFAKIKIS